MSNNIHQLPDLARIEQEAGEWIARLHADDVDAADLERFETWRATHPRHARAYEELAGTIDEVKRAGRIVRAVSFGQAMQAAADPTPPARRRVAKAWPFAVAAMLALVVVSALLFQQVGPQTMFQTAIGERASIELPDGSKLDLNSNSMARVEFGEHARTIRLLRGEAFFNVAHDTSRPFWVVAGPSWVRAVGTAFNVDLHASDVRVTVSEGTVKVATGRAKDDVPSDASLEQLPVSLLTAGQFAQVRAGAADIRAAQPLELARVAAWRKGKLYFENQPLELVVEEMGRYTSQSIVLDDDEQLRRMLVGGTFQANAQGTETLLEILEQGFGLKVSRRSGGQIYIEEPASR